MTIIFDEFFNTTHLSGESLIAAKNKCSAQESRILEMMIEGTHYTPFDIHRAYNDFYPNTPITSIRRAITCLTKKGYLKKLSKEEKELKTEIFGSPNHYWEKL